MTGDPFCAAAWQAARYGGPINVSNRRKTTVTLTSGTWAWQLRLPLAIALVLLLILAILPPAPAGAASCVVTSALDDNRAGTLRARLADPACNTITFQNGLGPITLTAGLLIDRTVTVEGSGQIVQYYGAQNATGYVLKITGGKVTLQGLTIQGGRTADVPGAGISISGGDVTLDGVTVRDNNVEGNAGGGGIYVTNAALRLNNTVVADNVVQGGYGGGGMFIDSTGGNVAVTIANGSQIIGNQALAQHGGGILVSKAQSTDSATLTMTDSILGTRNSPNIADQIGGGLNSYGGTLSFTNVYIGGNVGEEGGGIFASSGTTTLTNVTIDGNTALRGGGYTLDRGTATLTNVTISDNQATRDEGGGIYSYNSTALLTNVTIAGNTTNTSGGGFYNNGSTTALTNVTVSGNSAEEFGGGIFNKLGGMALRFVTITDNTADKDRNAIGADGGLARIDGAINLSNSIVMGNRVGLANSDDCSDGITSQGNNLVGNATGCPSNGPGDLALSGAASTVLVTTLADNGGVTRTHALVPNSPAIDRIPLTQCNVNSDQRGITRPQGSLCDIGAVERAPKAALTVATVGGGSVGRFPAGGGNGPFDYDTGTIVRLTAQPNVGQTFTGWAVDGVNQGWANPLTLTMDAAHSVRATFAPTVRFTDVAAERDDHAAIIALAARGTIRGYGNGNFGPDDRVTRAQMAALIARATPNGPGTPPMMLTPPACLVVGSWDCEDWGTNFSDRGGVDPNLWRNAGALQHYGVALGYGANVCAAKGVAAPCFGPNDEVTYAQTISFITRAMIAKGYWAAQPNAPLPYGGVPAAHQPDVRTFRFYTGGIPAPPTNWDDPATRGWFARALWAALDSYWSTDRVP
jgi:hypothetical protein